MHEIKYDWFYENREYLVGNILHTKSLLASLLSPTNDSRDYPDDVGKLPVWTHGEPLPCLEILSNTFHLTNFEKMILVLCAGAEIDGEVSALCSKLYKNSSTKFPTFDIAMRALPGADWLAILPDSNLRRYHLITVHSYDDVPLLTSTLRIQERILHYLLGFNSVMDNTLDYLVRPVQLTAPVAPSHRNHISDIVELYEKNPNKTKLPIFLLRGTDAESGLLVAQNACHELGLGLWNIPGDLIPSKTTDEQMLSGILSRECFLSGNALYIDAVDLDQSAKRTIARFAGRTMVPLLFLGTCDSWSFVSDKPTITLDLKRPTREDQRQMWKECIDRFMLNNTTKSHYLAEIDRIANTFNLDAVTIEGISKKISLMQDAEEDYDPQRLYSLLQSSAYRLTKNRLGDLAEEIIPVARIEDIVLPASRKSMIKTIAVHFRHRRKVYNEWGFAKKSSRGLGIIALFSGESGTGKTMAAEAIANELGTDIYRIDLSMVASKYIGETEKNLRQIFDAAETKECILFFDEADSLFGKRSEVRDSHDRYANMQVGYLLQRIESYDGIVILATNFKKSLDPAFIRRVRFIIDFPFPDEASREEIWRGIFPSGVPLDSLDFKFLSKLSITGGGIRNIALNAAFLAAEEGTSVSMAHIKRAAEEEYTKIGRAMSTAEVGDWP